MQKVQMTKIFDVIVNAIFIVLIVLLLAYFALRVTGKIEIYNVKTGSMEEQIHVGDYILIFRKNNYKVGDVVTFTSGDGFITHRIIQKNGNKVITKGDANNAEDQEIYESSIVGKVIICGGLLNIIINYKYAIVCVLLSLYLFSCYFGKEDNKEEKEQIAEIDSVQEDYENLNTEELEDRVEELKEEAKKVRKVLRNKKKNTNS